MAEEHLEEGDHTLERRKQYKKNKKQHRSDVIQHSDVRTLSQPSPLTVRMYSNQTHIEGASVFHP